MADEPENLTLMLLREMRAELGAIKTELAEIKEQTKRIPELQVAVAAIRTDQGRTNELLEQVHETQQNQGARLNAIDGRLALIEKHTGMVKA
jgi:hypothetical protein